MSDLVIPTLNLNGTAKKSLIDDYLACLDALRAAQAALERTSPHPRDYQTVTTGTWQRAAQQHRARYRALQEVMDEINTIAERVFDQTTGR